MPKADTVGEPHLGFCATQSGKAGCVGERKVTPFNGFAICDHCWPHRKRIARELSAQARRRGNV